MCDPASMIGIKSRLKSLDLLHKPISEILDQVERDRELRKKYEELIHQVETKYPGESRHETAKRYIHERENRPSRTGDESGTTHG